MILMRNNCLALIILLVLQDVKCGFLDYTDFEDPFFYLWNAKNQVTRQPNSACTASVGNLGLEGVCKSYTECQLTGGVFGGSCGLLSTCCVYMGSCGSKMSAKTSYFQGIPVSNKETCTFQVQLHNRNICQLRLDFLQMVLSPPAQNDPHKGTCRDDKFFVEGYSSIPQICGKNTGQHIYLNVNGNDTNPITLRIDMLSNSIGKQGWTIQITQLQCPGITTFPYRAQIENLARDFRLLAPLDCLQYFTDLKGSFKSFGYDTAVPGASAYNVNQSYAICFKRQNGICGISYSPVYFKVGDASSTTYGEDYLYIPALRTSDTNLKEGKLKGQIENTKYFTSVTPGPLHVAFYSDPTVNRESDVGFHVNYELLTSCPSSL